jgi:hypothetical protein
MENKINLLKRKLKAQIKNCSHGLGQVGARCFCDTISCPEPDCKAHYLRSATRIEQHYQKKHPDQINQKNMKKTKIIVVPTTRNTSTKSPRSTKIKSSPIDYYNCLMNYAQAGFYDAEGKQKIHSCCKKCKLNAPTLNNQRDKELVTLIKSYKQVGDSLAKLLKPLK